MYNTQGFYYYSSCSECDPSPSLQFQEHISTKKFRRPNIYYILWALNFFHKSVIDLIIHA